MHVRVLRGSPCAPHKLPSALRARTEMDTVSVVVPGSLRKTDYFGKAYTVYLVELQVGSTIWKLERRYRQFRELCDGLAAKYPKVSLPEFPRKQLWHTEGDIEARRKKLQQFLQEIVAQPLLLNSWEVQFFVEIKKHAPLGTPLRLKVLCPLPAIDFDPTEVSVPWKILSLEGVSVVFATETGEQATADPHILHPQGFIQNQLSIDEDVRLLYQEMTSDASFSQPITWDAIDPKQYDGLLLCGGHAPGMRSYLESAVLHRKVSEFWALHRPVAAICHGTLLLSRCKDSATGKSLLYHRSTSTLPKYMENAGAAVGGVRYHTYDVHCEDEVRSFLERDVKQCQLGPDYFGKGGPYQQGGAFVCEDDNYISARWPGDAYWFGRRLLEKLYEAQNSNAPTSHASAESTSAHEHASTPTHL